MENKNSSLEDFILKKIKQIEADIVTLKEQINHYSVIDYSNKYSRLVGQKDILYMCLTGHDNKYEQEKVVS